MAVALIYRMKYLFYYCMRHLFSLITLFTLLALFSGAMLAQRSAPPDARPVPDAATATQSTANAALADVRGEAPPIQDNSFLIEEAYNQEFGVVQHISNFTRLWSSGDWVYSFTQEWPGLKNARHQYSYTVQALGLGASPGAGVGDTLLNYRYQLVGDGEARVAFAPRASLILPSGASRQGRGYGGWGAQFSLPLSVVLNKSFVTHWNAGTTLIPRARDAAGERAFAAGYNLGQSVVWLAADRLNFLVETVYNSSQTVTGRDRVATARSIFVSPGLRWAWNLRHRLQIVQGVAMPIGVGSSAGERGVFVYLSFEHPFMDTTMKPMKQ